MKFFNIDLHISVIADIKNILENLGHEVKSLSLSGHSWVFKKSTDATKIINQHNWQKIDEQLCDDFYNAYKEELKNYDAFICAYPPVFSLLYKKFNKPIIVVAATRYDFPFTNDDKKLKWLNDFLSENHIIRIANNLLDQRYCEERSDLSWQHIPSLCEYTNEKYSGTKSQSVLFSKIPLAIPSVINKDSLGKYSWKDLYSYKCILHIPYNFSTMSIFEQYTANVPLIFPTKELLLELFKRKISLSEISFNQVIGIPPVAPSHKYDINAFNNLETIKESIELSDFYDSAWMPNILYFNNEEELSNVLFNTNFIAVSDLMKQKNTQRKQDIYKSWEKILEMIK